MAIFSCEKNSLIPFEKRNDDEFDEIKLWDLNENIGYMDEIDLNIITTIKHKKIKQKIHDKK